MNISIIKGIGPKSIDLFKKLNITTINDLIEYYPYSYNVYKISELIENENIMINGIVESIPKVMYIKKNFNKLTFRYNTNGIITNVVIFNRAFLKEHISVGRSINCIGKYDMKKNTFTASDIKFEMFKGTKLEPKYHLINGINNKTLIRVINECLNMNIDIDDYIPSYLVNKYKFINKIDAIKEIHNPTSNDYIKKSKLRLIYEEFFIFMFKINFLKYKYLLNNEGLKRNVDYNKIDDFINKLPFKLTVDQLSAVKDIYNDLCDDKRMNRLLLGDVGSGKTIVSFIAMYINYLSGYQSALMVPTEVLARQHYKELINNFKDLKIALLVGSMTKKEKNIVLNDLENGNIDFIVGTHSLISDKVIFNNLGLVITDEQHRFGVNQRGILQNKGIMCDVLYMSATPIPRTYALTVYGDMDTSLIKTKPSGRKDIITKVVKEKDIKEVLNYMLIELKNNHQIYVVSPLIEDDEENPSGLNDVIKLKEKFSSSFSSIARIEILHGKMNNNEKEKVMNDFKNGDINILISTTVIEVGIDVKNATMMCIFNSERFGLATLHQLRGRVGRNELQSKCYLICNSEIERLKVLEESNDGFYISQRDFELRGEGDLFGIKQSGDMVFKLGDLRRDYKILLQCKNDSLEFLNNNINNKFNDYMIYNKLLNDIDFID